MAEVFAGRALGSHGFAKPVAVKRLLPELANDHVFVTRLIGEAKLVVGMQHGNIVSVLDLAREGDDVFLVMEYVDGPSLRQLLKARGARTLPLGVVSYIVQSAAAGLDFAHQRSIIHADVSPSNLLLSTSGEVRVADFGIARRPGRSAGVVEGKWAYMAPEQVRDEPLTPGSDVFSLGVVLYELLTGEHPIGRKVTADDRDAPLRIIPPRIRRPDLPVGIDAVCMRALAPDPRDRFSRMQQLIDALVDERYANGWREGASELAAAIREDSPQREEIPAPSNVTLATRSLLAAELAQLPVPVAAFSTSVDATPHARRHSLPNGELVAPVVAVSTHARASHRTTALVLGATAALGALAAVTIPMVSGDSVPAASAVHTEKAAPPIEEPAAIAAPVPAPPPPAAVVTAAPEPVAPAPAPAPVRVAPPPVQKAHVTAAAPKKVADAKLIVRTEGRWAFVSVGGQRKETPPQVAFKLAPGTYKVVAKNTDDNITVRCNVTVAAGESKKLTVIMDEGQCFE